MMRARFRAYPEMRDMEGLRLCLDLHPRLLRVQYCTGKPEKQVRAAVGRASCMAMLCIV